MARFHLAAGRCSSLAQPPSQMKLLFLFAFILLTYSSRLATATPAASVYETDEYIRIQPELDGITHKVTDRTVLAYITPWNSKGIQLADKFVDKLDLVSPVWYTILISPDSVADAKSKDATYTLSGGPTCAAEEEWLERTLSAGKVKVTPRFYLDNWQQSDYATFLSSASNWQRLASLITDEVSRRNYDGIVFESPVSHLLYEPISTLRSSLSNKILTLVMPPLRTAYSSGGTLDRMQNVTNQMAVQSIPQLAPIVDYFSIMTYDMTGAGGRMSNVEGKDFPQNSPLRGAKRGSLRGAGPNTSPKWVRENVRLIEAAVRATATAKRDKKKREAEDAAKNQKHGRDEAEGDDWKRLNDPSDPFAYDDFTADEELDEEQVDKVEPEDSDASTEQEHDDLALIRGKLLMGMPMYAYRYPLFWIDKSTGQGIPVPPPTNPFEGKQLHTRSDPLSDSALLPLLRGPGEAITIDTVLSILRNHDGVILDPKDADAEGYFDYAETVTPETLNGRESHGVKPGDQIYWRMYVPLPSTTQARLEALDEIDELQAGVSLWELGQASSLLLHAL